jgi:hypothetical protein
MARRHGSSRRVAHSRRAEMKAFPNLNLIEHAGVSQAHGHDRLSHLNCWLLESKLHLDNTRWIPPINSRLEKSAQENPVEIYCLYFKSNQSDEHINRVQRSNSTFCTYDDPQSFSNEMLSQARLLFLLVGKVAFCGRSHSGSRRCRGTRAALFDNAVWRY